MLHIHRNLFEIKNLFIVLYFDSIYHFTADFLKIDFKPGFPNVQYVLIGTLYVKHDKRCIIQTNPYSFFHQQIYLTF